MADIKISELEPTTDLEGLFTIGSDKNNLSKKVSLQFLKDAANYANEQGDYAKQAGDTVNGNVGVSDYPEFSASKSYVIGDIVRYNGVLYAFTANHAASAWNGNDVKATSINAITSGKLTELESEVMSGQLRITESSDVPTNARKLQRGFSSNRKYALYLSNTTFGANVSSNTAVLGLFIKYKSENESSILTARFGEVKPIYVVTTDNREVEYIRVSINGFLGDEVSYYFMDITDSDTDLCLTLSPLIVNGNHLTINLDRFGERVVFVRKKDGSGNASYGFPQDSYEFADGNSLILEIDGTIRIATSSTDIPTSAKVLLYYNNGFKGGLLYPYLIASTLDEVFKIEVLSKDSHLDSDTPLYGNVQAGEWNVRYNEDTIERVDDYFRIVLKSQNTNKGIWILTKNLKSYIGKKVKVSFRYKSDVPIGFTIGWERSKLFEAKSDWTLVSFEETIQESAYNDWRFFIYERDNSNGYIDISNISIKIDSAELPVNNLKGKKISILGDSISTFGYPNQNNAEGVFTYPGNRCRYPQSNLLTSVAQTYWKLLIDKYGMVLGINESWAGSMVSNTQSTDSGDYGPNRCIASSTRIGHLGENGKPDIILVYAGTNDIIQNAALGVVNLESPINYTKEMIDNLSVDTFANAYRTMLIRLLYNYKDSKIVVVLPNFVSSAFYSMDELDKYIEVIKEYCDFYGVEYIDLRSSGFSIYNYATYMPDSVHPNADGMRLIATRISERLNVLDKTPFSL